MNTITIQDLKQASWAVLYAWCVGKTTLATTDSLYHTTIAMSRVLVEHWIGIIHGWYEDGKWWGTMQGYAQWASIAITEYGMHPAYNIWIPESRFDAKRWVEDRTWYNTQFCTPQENMDLRCGLLIDSVDFLVVNQLAGNWTLREVFTAYERNDIHKPNNLDEWKIMPIVFFWKNWKKLFEVLWSQFALGTSLEEDENLFFVESMEEYERVILAIKKKLLG